MEVKKNISLENFEAWEGAIPTKDAIINANKCEEFEALIKDLYPNGIEDGTLNDLLWFNDDWVFESLGISPDDDDK